ncbi:hypothetical protein PENSPDRAFT_652042 [Peniophora sp. CONT]|nr:hypothetical protein PENSPDRAFT_652042 [Peniophora sp. CONT]
MEIEQASRLQQVEQGRWWWKEPSRWRKSAEPPRVFSRPKNNKAGRTSMNFLRSHLGSRNLLLATFHAADRSPLLCRSQHCTTCRPVRGGLPVRSAHSLSV